jgi:hypothetical protein
MDPRRIEEFLRQGPPDEPRYMAARFRPPQEVGPMIVSRPAFRAAVPAGAGLLLMLLLAGLAVFAMLRAGAFTEPGGNPGFVPATSAPVPTPTPTSTPTATPVPATPKPTARTGSSDCSAKVTLKVTSVEGAAGSRIFSFEVANGGDSTCSVYVKRASIVDRGRTPAATLVSTDVRPAHQLILRAGGKATGMTRWSNECASVRGPLALKLDLTSGRSISSDVPGSAAEATPPCNGPGKPNLEIRFD